MIGTQVPEWISERIGPAGYGALTELLESDTIANEKIKWSVLAKQDIGTPETVRRIVISASIEMRLHLLLPSGFYLGDMGRVRLGEGCKNVDPVEFVKLAAAGYLLGTNFSDTDHPHLKSLIPRTVFTRIIRDMDGKDQLEGELRRHWAQKNGIPYPASVTLDIRIVQDYCTTHKLGEFYNAFAARMK